MKYTFDLGPLALDDAATLLGEVRKVVHLISIAAQGADPASTVAPGAICATADLAGEKLRRLRRVWTS